MSGSGSDRFDLVLALDYFRFGGPHLCLIRALAPRYRIGLWMAPLAERERVKAGHQQAAFVAACREAGAELIEGGEHRCDLLVVQQRPYDDAVAREILAALQPRRVVGLMGLAMAGLAPHERYLAQFGVTKVYVPNERLRRFLVARRDAEALYHGIEVEQIGLPYARERLVPEFTADWIVATPTSFSFRHETHRQAFLETVLRLLAQIPPEERVVYKPHNSQHRDYLAPARYTLAARTLGRLPGATGLAAAVQRLPGPIGRVAGRFHTACLHERVLRRCVPLGDMTALNWLPFEAFLPGVRKGVIGGLSNTIWGTLYFELPFYNCVDRELRDRLGTRVDGRNKDSTELLDLNLQFFNVPYCDGRLGFPEARGPGIVAVEDRDGDLVAAVERDLAEAKSLSVVTVPS